MKRTAKVFITATVTTKLLQDRKNRRVLTGNQQTLDGKKEDWKDFVKKIKEAGREIRFCAETDKQFQEEMKAAPDILAALDSDAMEMALDWLDRGRADAGLQPLRRRALRTGSLLPGQRAHSGHGRAGRIRDGL